MPQPSPPPPSDNTLAKYGLTRVSWHTLVRRQGGLCPICQTPLAGRPVVVDHAHVKGFEARKVRRRNGKKFKVRVMPPAERRVHVRGVLHNFCNRYVRSWLTLERAQAIVEYLAAHEKRKKADV